MDLATTASAAEPLGELARLPDDWLFVFVAGPGVGEGIAVALPRQDWLVIDGCRMGDRYPLIEILSRWRRSDDRIRALLLTHPHQDHSEGLARLIEAYPPDQIGVSSADGTGASLLLETEILRRSASATTESLQASAVLSALKAIARWRDDRGRDLVNLCDGTDIAVEGCGVSARVCAPDKASLGEFLDPDGLEARLKARANELSAVVELQFGATRIVLGSDMPRYRTNTTAPVGPGWNRIMGHHQRLADHTMLKVPHHGSSEAQHPDLMCASEAERIWCVTPYSCSRLPRLSDGEGLAALLDRQDPVCLTALPASKVAQTLEPSPGSISLHELRGRMEVEPTDDPFINAGTDIRPRVAADPLDMVWCFAFDDRGALRGSWRGGAARSIVRDS